jgi:thymidylate synthase
MHIDKIYNSLVQDILDEGMRKENRTGVDTVSTFGLHYNYDLLDGFPLLTGKQISWKNIVVEMLWFLSGKTDIEILRRHGCKFWDAWADEEGKVPSAYGNFWRSFPVPSMEYQGDGNDQIRWAVEELKRNPMSRRVVVSAWAPGNAQTSKLPPCHCMFVFNVQNDDRGQKRLCLHLTQRSCDVALGVPYNIASYALLLHIVARLTGLTVGTFSHTLVDAHIYTKKPDGSMSEYDHVPGLEEQIAREILPSPSLHISSGFQRLEDLEWLLHPTTSIEEILKTFELRNYKPHSAIAFKVAV